MQYLVLTKDLQNRLSDKELEEVDEVQDVEILSLPKDFIDEVFSKNKPLTIFQDNVTIEDKTIKIPFSLKKFDFQNEQKYEIEGFLNYNFENNAWATEMI